jgi:CrcB protein
MNYLLVAIGGAFGSLSRYKIGKILSKYNKKKFPVNTFLINITGAILLGYITFKPINKYIYLLFTDGFLGAFTTFSTFMYEGFTLFKEKYILNAFIYIILSLLLGIIGFVLGVNFKF